jgi:HSP20 family protein
MLQMLSRWSARDRRDTDWSKEAMTMLMRTDPFQVLDRWTQQVLGQQGGSRPVGMPMDAYRQGDEFVVAFDLPGVDPASIDLSVERNALTVRAERQVGRPEDAEVLVAERPYGVFSRQLLLGDALDAEAATADYTAGVLTLHIPVAAQATPRKIEIQAGRAKQLTS